MPRSPPVKIEPKVLVWLRESSGWQKEETAKRLNVATQFISELESGKRDPSLAQLKRMSAAYKYPLASFFLPKPREKPLPKDYRSAGGNATLDKGTLLAIRRSRDLQEIGAGLLSNMNRKVCFRHARTGTEADPSVVADRYRKLFAVSWKEREKILDARGLFNRLRRRIENTNVLVFEFSFPVKNARGFALADDAPPVIVVNSKDKMEARTFALMHEFGHVLLGKPAIDMPEEWSPTAQGVEGWCNRFASEFLLPDMFCKDALAEYSAARPADAETLNGLSKKFKIGRTLLLRKMLDMNILTEREFHAIKTGHSKTQNACAKSRGMAPDVRCISEVGERFVSLVADNLDKNLITYNDALTYLSVKADIFDKVVSGTGR